MSAVEKAYALQAEKVIKAMKQRGFDACYVQSGQEAFAKVLSLIEKGSSIAFGGSETVRELGLLDYFRAHGDEYEFHDRSLAKTSLEKREYHAKAALSDYFLMSTNAFTADGQLVNIDGSGNRVANLTFGPEHVILIASMNKMAADVEDAFKRIKLYACPPNCVRLEKKSPCALTGFCSECGPATTICSSFSVTRANTTPGRIIVILVGEKLGY